jgi:hypothetical protein
VSARLTRHVLTAAAILVPAAVASAAPGRSVVLDYNAATHTATVLSANGRLLAVQAPSAPRAGSAVRLVGSRAVRPGTVAASLARIGNVNRARVTAMVVARSGNKALALAGPGTTLLVRLGGKTSEKNRVAHEVGNQPAVGSTVTADLAVDPAGNVTATNVTQVAPAQATQTLEIEGNITAVDPTGRTITLVDTEHGLSVSYIVAIPADADITAFTAGKNAEIKVSKAADGTLTLATVDDDDEGDDGDHANGDDHKDGGTGAGQASDHKGGDKGSGHDDKSEHRVR